MIKYSLCDIIFYNGIIINNIFRAPSSINHGCSPLFSLGDFDTGFIKRYLPDEDGDE
jgi:hypothetical protein